ncbi:hypothetical protein D6783_00740 [Candidatus Woesearchaeota archaeon]|nr:MAG: hypothetical protein D6783_00740 [Candidatus Woesearchaeota archaeon]
MTYPQWEEVFLDAEEELTIEEEAKEKNLSLMKECLDDAKRVLQEKGLKGYETSIAHVAVALFEKRASHQVFWKERKLKEKFDALYGAGKTR